MQEDIVSVVSNKMKHIYRNLDHQIANEHEGETTCEKRGNVSFAMDKRAVLERLSKRLRSTFTKTKNVQKKSTFSKEVFHSTEKYTQHERVFMKDWPDK